ncbi:MAG TPA: beta-phosphoglucomutase [Saprospiraceae bacterium]|nr:beta-phosphoglucomutase [Saprospiraceae bacterium]
MLPISLGIFDLDGVIVDTAKYHYMAWRNLARDFKYDLTVEQNEKLKGVSRVDSLNLILSWANTEKTAEEKALLCQKKNEEYLKSIQAVSPKDILPGVHDFILELKRTGVKIALGSASKNAKIILEQLGIIDLFDAIVDGNMTTKGKPDPEVFTRGAAMCSTPPGQTVVFEDAAKGIEAAKAGGMYAVGVGDESSLNKADFVMDGFEGFSYALLIKKLKI